MKLLLTSLLISVTIYCVIVWWIADDYKQMSDRYYRGFINNLTGYSYISLLLDTDTAFEHQMIRNRSRRIDSCDAGYKLYKAKYERTMLLLPEFLR